ncbi:nucleotidyltransferase domain-containing protein [Rhizocola hellebori]|uniref:nucleotidyltransferase domain-containing protein n=1 Tax=Rhizocola hellebori TaxID=1392758 RepID=UPI00194561B5|nr:nucleotidyltransferase domain-containing protein [Rhizocola hellebori]
MFDTSELERVRKRLLELASADPDVVGAAVIGSHALGHDDRWSDIDLAIGVRGPLTEALQRWTLWLQAEFDVMHHWDLPSGPSVYRLFLLPGLIEIDIGFMPAEVFGPRGPNWRTVFGSPAPLKPTQPPNVDYLIGMAWHDVLAGHKYLSRGRFWQAEHWISSVRDQVLALACLRLGHPTGYAKGAHLLPASVTEPLQAALIRSLDEPELRRALTAAIAALTDELALSAPALAARLTPLLARVATDRAEQSEGPR